jgi:hypothetical protein
MDREKLFEAYQVNANMTFNLNNLLHIADMMIPDDAEVGRLVKMNKAEFIANLNQTIDKLRDVNAELRLLLKIQ